MMGTIAKCLGPLYTIVNLGDSMYILLDIWEKRPLFHNQSTTQGILLFPSNFHLFYSCISTQIVVILPLLTLWAMIPSTKLQQRAALISKRTHDLPHSHHTFRIALQCIARALLLREYCSISMLSKAAWCSNDKWHGAMWSKSFDLLLSLHFPLVLPMQLNSLMYLV